MKNRKIFMLFLFVFILNFNFLLTKLSANALETVEWTVMWGGDDNEYLEAMTIDSSDNIYLAGSTASFTFGERDMCLIKYNDSGVLQWNRTWGGSQFDYGEGIGIDSSGNVYLMGTTLSFGAWMGDVALLKYNSFGILQWNKTWGGNETDYGEAIAIDSSDNIFVAGRTTITFPHNCYAFLLKFDSSGALQWNRTWGGGITHNWGNVVGIDSLNNIYLVGYWRGSEELGQPTKIFLVKYNTAGIVQWSRVWSDGVVDLCIAMTTDSSDNIYLTGKSGGKLLLLKYDSSGNLQWERFWEHRLFEIGRAITCDSSDNIYVVGETNSFGSWDEYDVCFLKYNSSGELLLNKTWLSDLDERGKGVALDSSENIYIAGDAVNLSAFISAGLIKASSDEIKYDLFLMKISYASNDASTINISGYNLFLLISIICAVSIFLIKKRHKLN